MRLTLRRGGWEVTEQAESYSEADIRHAAEEIARVMDLVAPTPKKRETKLDPHLETILFTIIRGYADECERLRMDLMQSAGDQKAVLARLREKIDGDPSLELRASVILKAIEGALNDPWNQEKGLTSLSWICKSWSRIQQQAAKAKNGQNGAAVREWARGKG